MSFPTVSRKDGRIVRKCLARARRESDTKQSYLALLQALHRLGNGKQLLAARLIKLGFRLTVKLGVANSAIEVKRSVELQGGFVQVNHLIVAHAGLDIANSCLAYALIKQMRHVKVDLIILGLIKARFVADDNRVCEFDFLDERKRIV